MSKIIIILSLFICLIGGCSEKLLRNETVFSQGMFSTLYYLPSKQQSFVFDHTEKLPGIALSYNNYTKYTEHRAYHGKYIALNNYLIVGLLFPTDIFINNGRN